MSDLNRPERTSIFDEDPALDWFTLGNTFVSHLLREAEASLPLRGAELGLADARDPSCAFRAELDIEGFTAALQITPTSTSARFEVIARDGCKLLQEDVDTWRALVERALERVSTASAVPWHAVIGTQAGSIFEVSDQELALPAIAAGLTLQPAQRITERHGSSLIGTAVDRPFCPIIVEGICTESHDWGIEAAEEGVLLRRLCALLTLGWNRTWTPKLLPTTGDASTLGLQPAGPPDNRPGQDLAGVDLMSYIEAVAVPDWLQKGFNELENDQGLEASLSAFYEGSQLYSSHPSMSLMAFVGCADSIGFRLGASGSRSRVREALRWVLDESDAVELMDAYTHRNSTAHEGVLHGGELSLGLHESDWLTPISPNASLVFELSLLRPMRDAVRKMLIKSIRSC